ncbi:MAG: L-2-hydroxyglutarate oxidase [Ignavibacteriaceae bacterium]
MFNKRIYDIIVIGGGIVGCATGMALAMHGKKSVLVIEAEKEVAFHQTGNNSGVIHSGLYYKPGSMKAENCVRGRELMYKFCEENGIKFDRCGKLVVATERSEIPRLNDLEERGRANGLTSLKRVQGDEIEEYEPNARGIGGLFVGETGIVDYKEVTKKYAEMIRENGGEVNTDCKFLELHKRGNLVVETSQGDVECRYLVNCGGLQSDRIAKLCGVDPKIRIIPFRGEYYMINKSKEDLVRNLIYPVPDPRFPFLGVHFTRMINGGCEAGPNAVLAFKREGYKRSQISVKDTAEMIVYPGFWIMASKFYKMGIGEFYRSFSKDKFLESLQRLVPAIGLNDIERGGAGVRAQALSGDGNLLDDFCIEEGERMIHVLNAPSPAATASISIGEIIAKRVISRF